MDEQTKHQALLHRLLSLADQPQEQIRYVLELLERVRGIQVVSIALAYVTSVALPEARPALLRLYDYYGQVPLKRDAGGRLRSSNLAALQPIAHLTDRSLAEHAAMTYEFLPPKKEECAGGLRVAGLSLLETKGEILLSAFALVQHDPVVTGLIQQLQQKQRLHTRDRYFVNGCTK